MLASKGPKVRREVNFNMTDTTADLINIQNKYPGTFIVAMEYKKQQRRGAVEQAYLREEVARRLYVASNLLPDGFQFKILDAWRAYETQKDIYDEYYKQLLDQGYSQEETDKKILEFVSYPSVDPLEPFLH